MEPEAAEQAVLDEIRRLRQSGATLRGIAATLNHRGHQTRRGVRMAAGARGANHQAGTAVRLIEMPNVRSCPKFSGVIGRPVVDVTNAG